VSTLVLGIGNVVQRDDGAGVRAVQRLCERWDLDGEIEVVEGGTAGLLLLPWLGDADRVVLVDAVDGEALPGTIHRLDGDAWAQASAGAPTVHDVGVCDLLATARLAGMRPAEVVLIGVQPQAVELSTDLSAPVAAALDDLADAIARQLAAWGHAVHRRSRVDIGR
jgi:hydrogenase maturation protease